MRAELKAMARVFVPAYGGTMQWVLAGCGWGVVIGSALEAAFGQGADGLLDAAGEISLEAAAGALLGMLGGTLLVACLLACLHVITLALSLALVGKFANRYPFGSRSLGFMYERSARAGVVTVVVFAVIYGTYLFPLLGAVLVLGSIHGPPVPRTHLQWGTLAGILAGGAIGLVSLARTTWQALTPAWREEIRRWALGPAQTAKVNRHTRGWSPS